MADDGTAEEAPVTFNIKTGTDTKYVLTLSLSITVLDLKNRLSTSEYADVPPERQRLIYSGRVLQNENTLASYKIKDGNTVHLVKSAASNQRQNPANQSSTPTTEGSGATSGAQGVPTNLAAGTGNNPLAGLTGARYAGLAQLPGAGMFGPDGGMGAPPGPEQVADMLQNPQYASQLNEALANPDIVNSLIEGNPMLRGLGDGARQALNNPQFRQMMTNPDTLRQMAQMQRQFPNMFGRMGAPGGAQNQAFPAPGVTDQTPEQPSGERTATPNQPNTASQQPPMNPFGMMFGNPGTAGGVGANPLRAMFPPGQQSENTDSTAQSNQQSSGNPQQPQGNPFQQMAEQLASNPAFMQNLMGTLGGGGGGGTPNQGAGFGQTPPNNNHGTAGAGQQGQQGQQQGPFNNPFATIFGPGGLGMGGGNPFGMGGAASPQPPDNRAPEDRYADQLRQLNDMGFYEFERNVEALRRTGGSVQGAVEYLLTHP